MTIWVRPTALEWQMTPWPKPFLSTSPTPPRS